MSSSIVSAGAEPTGLERMAAVNAFLARARSGAQQRARIAQLHIDRAQAAHRYADRAVAWLLGRQPDEPAMPPAPSPGLVPSTPD